MHKLLIPLIVCLSATLLHAQVPRTILPNPKAVTEQPTSNAPEAACSAGTFVPGQFIGQSNDIDLDTIFLCWGDSLLMDHNGDQMFMDPNPATPPGIAYAFYSCPPTATGDDMAVLADPCIWPGSAGTGFFATQGPLTGDHWFFNTGGLFQATTFCNGSPCLITYAPITITDDANGVLEPGCVDVNINDAFSVIYLRKITELRISDNTSTVQTNYTDDCKARFRLYGGYPEWDLNATYTVSIALDSDPSVKALIYTPPAQMKHSNDIIFSVPQSGTYRVTVEDGKSCGHTFLINVTSCDASDNVTISMPELVAPPGAQICVPINMINYTNIIGASWSVTWDPTVLMYNGFQNPSDSLGAFDLSNLNVDNANQGFIGIAYSDFANPNGTTIPNGGTFVELCFTVLAPLGSCTPLDIVSFPSLVTMDNAFGPQLAITVDTGQICVDFVPLDVEFYVAPPNCDGEASVGAIISAGTAPFVVSWSAFPGGGMSGMVTANVADTILTNPLPEGVWEVCVTDQNGFGLMVCDTITIDVPNLGATLAVVQLPLCNGDSTGSLRADVTVDGVVLPNPGPTFTYLWNTTPAQTTQTISNIPAGGYSVTVTETVSGCTALAAGTLSQPPVIILDVQVTNASCDGIADGGIVTTVSGGTPGAVGSEYSFAWNYSPNANGVPLFADDSGIGNPFTMSNKPAGFYFVTVTDANGCTQVQTIEIANARVMTIDTLNILEPSCYGSADGCIEIAVNAQPAFPNPAYLPFWDPTGGTPTNVGNMFTYCDLAADSFGVVIIETNTGCSVTAGFVLGQPDSLSIAIVTQNGPSCQFQNDGTILVAGSGGTGGPNYTYTWSGGLPNGATQQNLTPGTYTVTMTDANGCMDSTSIALALPPPPPIDAIDSMSVVCGADGSLTVTAPTAVSYLWETLSGQQVGNAATVTGLPGDTYVLTIADAQNCVNMDTFTLAPVVPLFFADTSLILPTCNGGADGSIAIDVQGGTGGAPTYTWSSGQSTPVIIAIAAGTYTTTVTNPAGCTLVGTFVLPNPPGIVIQYNSIMPATCPNVCDGKVTLVTYYNTVPPTLANFNFMWEDGSTDSVRVDLCPGFNTVTVTDALNGCFRIDSVSIDSPPPFDVNFTTVPVTCFGGDDGEARVTVSGANGVPFTYLWNNGSTINTATGLMAGDATVTITDVLGCMDTFVTNITQPSEIVVTQDLTNTTNILCFGDNSGSLAVTVTGGTPTYTYQWANANGNLGTTNPLDNLSSGAYTVTVTDAVGCTGELPNLILSDPAPVLGTYMPWDPIICNGEETTLFIESISGGSGAPYQYSLDFGVFLDAGFPINMGGGEHYITYIDRLGCEYTDTIFVPEPDPIFVTFDPNDVEIELGDSLQLLPIVTGAVVDTFTWTPAALLSDPFEFEPYTRTYESETYTIVVYDENGCSATGSISVNIDPNRNVYIPNAFIPGNPAGLNDHFNVYVGRGVETVNFMRIYDRWGTLMYEREKFYPNNNDFAEGWDGRYDGKYLNPAVFVYVVEVKFLDGRVLLYRGDVTILR
ncbi:MAG: gliding motility-associated C-terminal domain-containing protein [Lewinellaceae bacterium]|nr:gliding motility-associated C-terminal domain-containing protein [Lewinellaceae bacterium]